MALLATGEGKANCILKQAILLTNFILLYSSRVTVFTVRSSSEEICLETQLSSTTFGGLSRVVFELVWFCVVSVIGFVARL